MGYPANSILPVPGDISYSVLGDHDVQLTVNNGCGTTSSTYFCKCYSRAQRPTLAQTSQCAVAQESE
jgi:hypothetical protein